MINCFLYLVDSKTKACGKYVFNSLMQINMVAILAELARDLMPVVGRTILHLHCHANTDMHFFLLRANRLYTDMTKIICNFMLKFEI
jgi:hypothetical protein